MKEKEKKQNSSKQILISLLFVTLLVIGVIGFSFAAFLKAKEGTTSNTINTGDISMTYTEDTNGISIENALPISDKIGKEQHAVGEFFDFTVKSTIVGTVSITYEITAVKDPKSTISDDDIKLYLEKQVSGAYVEFIKPTKFVPLNASTEIGSPEGSMVLKTVTKTENGNNTDNYRLKMWINENSIVDGTKFYTVKINVYGKTS